MMKHENARGAGWGWLALGAFVVGWDVIAPETLSHGVDRLMESRLGQLAAGAGVLAVAGHLLNIPERIGLPEADPILQIGHLIGVYEFERGNDI